MLALVAALNLFAAFASAVPVAAPAAMAPLATSPLATSPASKLRSIDNRALAIFKHLLLPIRTTRINSQHLHPAAIRIDSKRPIAHAELPVLSRHYLQTFGHIDVPALGTILRAKN